MRMLASNQRFATVFALSIVLSWAIEFNTSAIAGWGDDIARFVDSDVPTLTREYAEQHLQKIWSDAFKAPAVQAGELQMQIAQRVGKLKFPTAEMVIDVPTSIEAAKNLDAAFVTLRFDQMRLEEVGRQISAMSDACDRPSVYANEVIQIVGSMPLANVSQPDRPAYFILWDPTWVSTVISVVYDLINFSEDKRQRDTADEALRRLPRRIVGKDWVANRSREICREVRSASERALKAYQENLQSYAAHLNEFESRLWGVYNRIEPVLSKASLDDVRKRSGIWSLAVVRAHSLVSSRLLQDLEYAKNEIDLLKRSVTNSSGCSVSTASVEELEDAIIELKGQISVASRRSQLNRTSERLQEIAAFLELESRNIPNLYRMANSRGCQ